MSSGSTRANAEQTAADVLLSSILPNLLLREGYHATVRRLCSGKTSRTQRLTGAWSVCGTRSRTSMCRQGSRRPWSCRLALMLHCWPHSSKDLQLAGCIHWAAGQAYGAGMPLHAFSCLHKAMELQVVRCAGAVRVRAMPAWPQWRPSFIGLLRHALAGSMEAVQGCKQRLRKQGLRSCLQFHKSSRLLGEAVSPQAARASQAAACAVLRVKACGAGKDCLCIPQWPFITACPGCNHCLQQHGGMFSIKHLLCVTRAALQRCTRSAASSAPISKGPGCCAEGRGRAA